MKWRLALRVCVLLLFCVRERGKAGVRVFVWMILYVWKLDQNRCVYSSLLVHAQFVPNVADMTHTRAGTCRHDLYTWKHDSYTYRNMQTTLMRANMTHTRADMTHTRAEHANTTNSRADTTLTRVENNFSDLCWENINRFAYDVHALQLHYMWIQVTKDTNMN